MLAIIKDMPRSPLTEAQATMFADVHNQLVDIISGFAIDAMGEFHDQGLSEPHLVDCCVGALTATLAAICQQHSEPGSEARFCEMLGVLIREKAGLTKVNRMLLH